MFHQFKPASFFSIFRPFSIETVQYFAESLMLAKILSIYHGVLHLPPQMNRPCDSALFFLKSTSLILDRASPNTCIFPSLSSRADMLKSPNTSKQSAPQQLKFFLVIKWLTNWLSVITEEEDPFRWHINRCSPFTSPRNSRSLAV